MDPNQTAESLHTIQPVLFWLVASLTAVCALATVVTQNIVRAATWLLFTLAGTSAVFFLLGADLVGVTQLLVYVGGTLVLVVFGVMLTAQGPFISMKTSGGEWAISMVAGMLLLAVLSTAVMSEHVQEGAPFVRTEMVWGADEPAGKLMRSPAVKRGAPEFSRAQREAIAAGRSGKTGSGAGDKGATELKAAGGPKGGAGPKGGPKGGAPEGKGPAGGGAPKGKAAKGGGGAPKGKGAKGGGKKKQGGAPPQGKGGQGPQPPPAKGGAQPPPSSGVVTASSSIDRVEAFDAARSPQAVVLGEGFLGVDVGPAHYTPEKRLTRTSYLLPFEIVSVHLLVVLIGAAYLARAKRRRGVAS